MRYKNTDAVPVKERCSSWRPSDRYLPYANAECIGTKECDPCKCNGDEEKCDYYEHVRKRGAEKKKTADVVEIVQGHWIETKREWDFDPFYYIDYQCSFCGMREQNKSPFCRWCGTKMEAERRATDEN